MSEKEKTRTEETSNSKNTKKEDKRDVIYFRLNHQKQVVWASSDNTIRLSLIEAADRGVGVLYAMVDKEEYPQAYKEVMRALDFGILIQVSKKEYDKNKDSSIKVKTIDVNSGYTEAGSINRKAESLLLQLDVDELVKEIRNLLDPSLLATMIKKEENKQNKDKVVRATVLKALNDQLNAIKSNAMSELVVEGQSEPLDVDLKDVVLIKNKSNKK